MNCHETREILEEYRRRELEPDRARAVEAHLQGCPACRGILAREEAVARLRRAPEAGSPEGIRREAMEVIARVRERVEAALGAGR